MSRDTTTEITGVVKSLHKRAVSIGGGKFNVEFTMLDASSRLLPVSYTFRTSELAEAVIGSLRVGLCIRVSLRGQIDGSDVYYHGSGPIIFVETEPAPRYSDSFNLPGPPNADHDAIFTVTERRALRAALEQAKSDIWDQFHPTNTQMHKIEERLDELSRKIDDLRKFDWIKLFVTCLVGISVDLGCGSTAPETLVNLFKNLFAGIIEQRLLHINHDEQVTWEQHWGQTNVDSGLTLHSRGTRQKRRAPQFERWAP